MLVCIGKVNNLENTEASNAGRDQDFSMCKITLAVKLNIEWSDEFGSIRAAAASRGRIQFSAGSLSSTACAVFSALEPGQDSDPHGFLFWCAAASIGLS